MPKNTDICRVLFSAYHWDYFNCNYCNKVRRQLPSSGYGSRISHLRDKHPDYEADYLAHASSLAGNLHSFGFVIDKVANIYHWLEWVVDRNMPLSEVDLPTTRSMSRLKPISSKTLQKYLAATTGAVEKEIAKAIPPILVSYDQLFYILLALAPLGEADLTAASHCAYIRNILAIFGQSEESLKFLVDGNCATNQLAATLLGVPLVGCASHRFNLAIESILAEHEDLVGASLKTFNSVCKKLQEESISMKAVRLLFDNMVEIFPVTGGYRRTDAAIVHSPVFESAVVKVSRGSEADLTPEELQALHPFELEATASESTPSSRG
ncbi:hypothetical protein JG688_00017131 [Phytophthora aleatoria]|uniref:BED-type domain-containing protein n=1 Tax=Phytophthora aleatoria TaxID=2496075 RepID=A0A8J5ICZ7_9STRA|nr:hypothetical protein JG688_00017131 [Phytophthora aleatoria]